jgi:hypothetical protein
MLAALDPQRRHEHVEAVAASGTGVFETLKVISKLTLRTLRRRMTGDEPAKSPPPARVAQFRVQDSNTMPSPARTIAATTPIPAVAVETAPFSDVAEIADEVAQELLPQVDRNIIADAPVPVPEPQPEPVPVAEAATAPPVEPEIDFSRSEKTQKVKEEKVKVRSSVDVMAELEALRKRATASTPKTAKRDALADLAALRPKRNIQRTLNLQIPSSVLPRTKSVRVTLSFEDGSGVIESQDQKVELGDTTDVQSVSVNLKIDTA